jgi:hypothetical protein
VTGGRLAWQPYVEDIAARMRLGHWRITIVDESPRDDGTLASVHPWYGRHAATVRLSDGFLVEMPEEQRYVIIHELLHCHLAHLDKLIEDDLSTDAGRAYRLANEYAVDSLAQAIAPFLPLPPGVGDGVKG